jgi:hypothetical protein
LVTNIVNAGVKKFLIPFIIVDTLFFTGLAFWFFHRQLGTALVGKPDFNLDIRHPESKLTEIDLVNRGNGPGAVNDLSIDVSWPDADLVEAKGLSQFSVSDTGRRSERFFLAPSVAAMQVTPGQPVAVGWVKLTDDVPVRGEIVANSEAATQP